MKKFVIIMLTILTCALVIAACGNGKMEQTDDATGNNTAGVVTENATEQIKPSEFIGMEKAREIALKRANLEENGVIFEKNELENDDGIWKYDFEFKFNNIEYDVEIKADTGEVIAYETDVND